MSVEKMHGLPEGTRLDRRESKALAALLIAGVCMSFANQPAAASAQALAQSTNLARSHGQIRLDGDGFNVMNVQLVLGSHLRFANPGNEPLDIGIVTWRGKRVKTLVIPAHSHAAWKPACYGVYDYFDAQTTDFGSVTLRRARERRIQQPVARKNSSSFPVPAYGVIAVTNAAGGGIPLSSSHGPTEASGAGRPAHGRHRSFMGHGPWIAVSGATMTFEPWVLVVEAGQLIHVYNEDSMTHSFYPGDYPVMYKDHDRIRLYRSSFDGFRLKMNGGERSIAFRHPGIHHIVCLIHTIAWKHAYRPYPGYGGYPYVMDAVIIVVPRPAHG